MGLINRMAESIRSGIKNFLQITPASDKTITVTETSNHRSEEHTSELQSRGHLVCRLLLKKKKKKI